MTDSVGAAYGTVKDAVIFHCPYPMRVGSNPFHHQWEAAIDTLFADQRLAGSQPELGDLTVITYNTRSIPGLLERCFDFLGSNALVVLGQGVTDWNWSHKITLVDDYLRSGACTTSHLLCLDGDDVIVVGDLSLLLARFAAIGSEVVFCGTRGDQPTSPECWDFENEVGAASDPQHRHLNAGCYLGRTSYIGEQLGRIREAIATGADWCRVDGHVDDQLAWRQLHRREHPRIVVDHECRLFLRFDEDR